MRRQLVTLILTGVVGGLLLVSEAAACCHKKKACAEPAPSAAPAPCGGHKLHLFKGLHFCKAKRACAPSC